MLRPDLFSGPQQAFDVFCDQAALESVVSALDLGLFVLKRADGELVPFVLKKFKDPLQAAEHSEKHLERLLQRKILRDLQESNHDHPH